METKKASGGHYAWDCIGELPGKRLLKTDEKTAVCRKVSASMYRPSLLVVIAVKIMPLIAGVMFVTGIKYMVEAAAKSVFADEFLELSLFFKAF